MWRLLSLSLLTLLLCSCMQTQHTALDEASRRKFAESYARIVDKRRLWVSSIEQLPGTPVSKLVKLWGEPEKLGNNEYRWVKRYKEQGGGYYVEDGHTTSRIYETTDTGISKHVGYIKTPKERYVEPYINEGISCEIRVTAKRNGVITHASFDQAGSIPGRFCVDDFPFSEE